MTDIHIVEIDFKRLEMYLSFESTSDAVEFGKMKAERQFKISTGDKILLVEKKSVTDCWETTLIFSSSSPEPKPPLGLTPKSIVDSKRFQEVSEAIIRYCEARLEIPTEWLDEYNELAGRVV
jgi:hypothetical protein